ncbi:MAG: di-heme oxidoredictase family protein [Candidatus Hydrogenedentota bacterium]
MNDNIKGNIFDKSNWVKSCMLLSMLSLTSINLISCSDSKSASASAIVTIGERGAITAHTHQVGIDAGQLDLESLQESGKRLFDARFNVLDGQGRPGSTGTGAPRPLGQPDFVRTSSPEANSCSGCHAQPFSGGGGDFVANVFVLAQALDPVTFSVSPEFSNERNTLGMFGAGPIEMLAREMSADLITIRDTAKFNAATNNVAITLSLDTKGVNFGSITVLPNGKIDPSDIEGVDWDLIIKPFHQKGAVVSIREFTNNAMNHHHGMQSVERFGQDTDPDQDTVENELTIGDITAITLFQAALNTPGIKLPKESQRQTAALDGEVYFNDIGCTSCHMQSLELESPMFSEPNPYNPSGNLQVADVSTVFSFDMTIDGSIPRLEESSDGGAVVRAFTDLKRHNLNDEELNFFANEQLTQGMLTGFASELDFTIPAVPRPTEDFLTRKLWDVGNSMPYGHRGDLTTITEAIYYHGGDARESRDNFFALDDYGQDAIVEFLKTLQVLPDGSEPVVISE